MSEATGGGERVAVCICTADRVPLLSRLLRQLEAMELPSGHPTELIIVDNRPGGGLGPALAAFRERLPVPILLVEEATPGLSHARNRAVAEALARGAGWVAFIDDDDLPRPDWLARLLETAAETGADMVFGMHRPSPDLALPGWLKRSLMVQPKPFPRPNIFGLPGGAATCNALLSRRLLLAMQQQGPLFRSAFDRVGGEDTDFFVRAARRGFPYAVSERSEVWLMWQADRLTWHGLTRRSFRFGVSRWHLRMAHQELGSRPAELRHSCREMVRTVRRMVSAIGKKRLFARHYFKLVEQAAEAYAIVGGRYSYYDPPARSGGSSGVMRSS